VREQRLLAQPVPLAAVAVAEGAGNRRLLESLGALVVDGNPSTGELLRAIDDAGAAEVIVLPNDRNAVMAAEQAAAEAHVPVHVLPTETLQAGLTAMVAFDPARSAADNLAQMHTAARNLATGAITVASREYERDGLAVRDGQWLGVANGEPIVGEASFDDAALHVIERLLAEPWDLLTLYVGEGSPPLESLLAAVAAGHPGLEIQVHDGGQPNYPLLISAE
jgi:dihydroxyacetone kinase-like predicted kinase